jgi:hypothetical protein
LDLRRVVAAGAAAVGGTALIMDELYTAEMKRDPSRAPSTWMVLPRDKALGDRLRSRGWAGVEAGNAWMDDYIDLLGTLR